MARPRMGAMGVTGWKKETMVQPNTGLVSLYRPVGKMATGEGKKSCTYKDKFGSIGRTRTCEPRDHSNAEL